jgi:hypothetical protein
MDSTASSALVSLGLAGFSVPAVVLGVPGLLVLLVVAAQVVGGGAWLPIARRVLSRSADRNRSPARRSRASLPRR